MTIQSTIHATHAVKSPLVTIDPLKKVLEVSQPEPVGTKGPSYMVAPPSSHPTKGNKLYPRGCRPEVITYGDFGYVKSPDTTTQKTT